MSILKDIKNKYAEYTLKKTARNIRRQRNTCNLDNAQRVGIIFHSSGQDKYDQVHAFVKFLSGRKMQVSALGFVYEDDVHEYYKFYTGINLFSKKNLNWYGKPQITSVDDFIKEPFDILFDLTTEDVFPLKYISYLSVARFKTGRFITGENPYDFMVQLNNNTDIGYLIDQLKHYLGNMKVCNS